jgi:hypothetical protein
MMNSSSNRLPTPRRRGDAGAALVTAVFSLMTVSAFAALLLSAVQTERTGVVLDENRTQAMKLAEGALEAAESALLTTLSNYQPFPSPPGNAPFQELSGTTSVGPVTATWTVSKGTSKNGGIETAIPPVNSTDAMTGLMLTIEPHVLATTVRVGTSSLRMRRFVETMKAPIFQFLTYYANDLEILPGPAMTLSGRIHTNGDLYVAPGTSLEVTAKYFRTAHNLIRHRKDDGAMTAGWIKIQNAATNNLVALPSKADLQAIGVGSLYGLDSSFTGWDLTGDGDFSDPSEVPPFKGAVDALYQGTVKTGEHGVTPLAAPSIGSIQMYDQAGAGGGDFVQGVVPGTFVPVLPGTGTHTKGYFHKSADLTVVGTQVFNKAGTNITALMPAGFVSTKSLWDERQGKTLTCTQINVGKLGDMDGNASTKDPSPYYPANGLIYVARTDSTVTQPNGVVITNGKELNIPDKWNSNNYGGANPVYAGSAPVGAFPFGPAQLQGLTVVSPNPVYVHGDYNTKSKKPASVITDAINLLSKSWDFTKTAGQVKVAGDTTYNMAIITGNTNTTTGAYNGGFENLPRFHENWSGKNCTITGSFVNTWLSALAKAPWVYGGAYYSAPNRIWSYDLMFDQGKLPPFTPMVITTRTVAWDVSH